METKYIVGGGIAVLILLLLFWVNNKPDPAWISLDKCESEALSLAATQGGRKLQIQSGFYGAPTDVKICGGTTMPATACSSANADQLSKDAAAGKAINIAANGYNTYFGKDPCVGFKKHTTLQYRYM